MLTGGSGPDSTARLEVFLRSLAQLGWTESQNVRLDIRRGGGDIEDIRKYAAELAARTPDVIVTVGGPATGELLQATVEFIASAGETPQSHSLEAVMGLQVCEAHFYLLAFSLRSNERLCPDK